MNQPDNSRTVQIVTRYYEGRFPVAPERPALRVVPATPQERNLQQVREHPNWPQVMNRPKARKRIEQFALDTSDEDAEKGILIGQTEAFFMNKYDLTEGKVEYPLKTLRELGICVPRPLWLYPGDEGYVPLIGNNDQQIPRRIGTAYHLKPDMIPAAKRPLSPAQQLSRALRAEREARHRARVTAKKERRKLRRAESIRRRNGQQNG